MAETPYQFQLPDIVIPQRNVRKEIKDSALGTRDALRILTPTMEQYNPRLAQLEADTAARRFTAEADFIEGGAGDRVREILMGSSPEAAASLRYITSELEGLGPSDIETELRSQAMSDLRLGRGLSQQEIRDAQQAARAAYSARGLATGPSAAIGEVLARDALGREREAERRAFASGVESLRLQRGASDRAFSINALNATQAQLDPFSRIFGRQGSVVTGQVNSPASFDNVLRVADSAAAGNQGSALEALRLQTALQQQANSFAYDREDTIRNAGYASDIAAKNRSAAVTGAAIGAAGTIAAGAAIAIF